MVITVKLVEDKPKPKRQGRGFKVGKYWITRKEILKNGYLNKAEREALLDMCGGVRVKSSKSTKLKDRNPRPVARYYVDGIVYCDGSIDEVSEFYGV